MKHFLNLAYTLNFGFRGGNSLLTIRSILCIAGMSSYWLQPVLGWDNHDTFCVGLKIEQMLNFSVFYIHLREGLKINLNSSFKKKFITELVKTKIDTGNIAVNK